MELVDCVAISLSKSGRMRIYNRTVISSLIIDEEWTTLLNFKSKRHLIQFPEPKENLICPFVVSCLQFHEFLPVIASIILDRQLPRTEYASHPSLTSLISVLYSKKS